MKNKKLACMLVVGMSLLMSACEKIQQVFIDRQVKASNETANIYDKNRIKVILCGTGTPQVRSSRGQACTLIVAGGKLFLFDAGENALRNLETSHIPLSELSSVFITHWHSDHFNGLGGLINHTWINGRAQALNVYGPPGVVPVVKGLSMAYALDAGYRHAHFVPNEDLAFAQAKTIVIPPGDDKLRVYEEGGITIDAYRVNHLPVTPAYGYVLRYKDKKIFVSGDTKVTDTYLEAMQNADVVVHEAINTHLVRQAAESMRRQGMAERAEDALKVIEYHSDTLDLASLAEKAQVKHLVLTHLIPSPPNFIAEYLFKLGMSDRFKGEITLGEDAMEIDL